MIQIDMREFWKSITYFIQRRRASPFFLSERQWKMCAFSVTPNYRTSFSKRIFSLLHRNHSLIIISYRWQPIQELLFAVFPENEMFSIPQMLTPVLSQRLLSFSLSLSPSLICVSIHILPRNFPWCTPTWQNNYVIKFVTMRFVGNALRWR